MQSQYTVRARAGWCSQYTVRARAGWCSQYTVRARVGWCRVSIAWWGETASLTCNFYLSVSVQNLQPSQQIHPWDTVLCCWDAKRSSTHKPLQHIYTHLSTDTTSNAQLLWDEGNLACRSNFNTQFACNTNTVAHVPRFFFCDCTSPADFHCPHKWCYKVNGCNLSVIIYLSLW